MTNKQYQSNSLLKQDLIYQIKHMDDEVKHISLNLNKCSINASQNDIKKAFPHLKFLVINKVQPGYFQVQLQHRIDAINFIRQTHNTKIANQKFQVTLGNQNKQSTEKWTVYQKKKTPAEIKLEEEKKAAAAKKKQIKKQKLNQNSQKTNQLSQIKTQNQQVKTISQKKQTINIPTTQKSEWFNQDNKKDLEQKNKPHKQQMWSEVLDTKGKNNQKVQKKTKAKAHEEMWKSQLKPNNNDANKEQILDNQKQEQKVKQSLTNEQEKNKEQPSKKKKKNKKKPQQNEVKIQETTPKQQDNGWIVVKPKTKKK